MDDLAKLIAELERATEGSRLLDAKIVVALNLRPDWCRDTPGSLWIDDEYRGSPIIRLKGARKSRSDPPTGDYARLTTSLDAALSLVPEGWLLEYVGHRSATGDTYKPPFKGIAEISGAPNWSVWANAETMPLALCAASLKALAAMQATEAQRG